MRLIVPVSYQILPFLPHLRLRRSKPCFPAAHDKILLLQIAPQIVPSPWLCRDLRKVWEPISSNESKRH